MGEWKDTRFSEVADLLPGYAFKGIDFGRGTSRGVKIKDVQSGVVAVEALDALDVTSYNQEKIKKYRLGAGDHLITMTGNLGRVATVPTYDHPIYLNQRVAKLLPKTNVVEDFLLYVIKSTDFIDYCITHADSETAQPNISTGTILEYEFSLPPEDEQRAIASVLSSLDAKIDLLHRQNKTLEGMAEALFREWFVERRPEFAEGEAEEGWEEMRLDQFCSVGIGRTPPRKEQHWFSTDCADVKWISIKDMAADSPFIFTTAEYLTQEAVKQFRVPVIPKDTVVLSFKMTLGRVKITTDVMLSNEAIAHFRINPNSHVTKEFLYLGLKTYQYETLGSTSTIVDSINSGMIKEMVLQIPPEPLMHRLMEQCDPWFEKIRSNQVQISTLTALRDTLLPKLMSGEVRVIEH